MKGRLKTSKFGFQTTFRSFSKQKIHPNGVRHYS